VVVSTVSAIETAPFEGAYGTLKAALIRFAGGQAATFASEGIRVNVVSPGTIYSEDGIWGSMERENPEFFAEALAWNPMGRMGTPDEVARAIVFLASPAASFVTGTNLVVDGGLTKGVQF
jgi:NAD(P)-dependent dehydrogenase (short-subunit alcohol dehydrogenase family)